MLCNFRSVRYSDRNVSDFLIVKNPTVNLFIVVFAGYLKTAHGVDRPPNMHWHCSIGNYIGLSFTMCSNLFIVTMTFQRFYGIIQPHKAASFNTVKRAKITIACIVIFSVIYRFPRLFTTDFQGQFCVPYGKILDKVSGQFYYWLTFVLNFILPFVSLLIMNSVIIRTLQKRSQSNLIKLMTSQRQGQSQGQGENIAQGQEKSSHVNNTDQQIYTMLLLVTFSYLILTTPSYVMLLYINLVDPLQSPYHYAAYILFVKFGGKTYFSNFGINFFLYVLSGQKFRNDLAKMF